MQGSGDVSESDIAEAKASPAALRTVSRYVRWVGSVRSGTGAVLAPLANVSLRTRRVMFHTGTVLGICLVVLASVVLGPHYYQTSESDGVRYELVWEIRYVLLFALAGGVAGGIHATVALLPERGRSSRKDRRASGKVVTGWFFAAYVVVHIGVAGLCAWLAPTTSPASSYPTADYQIDAFMGALFFAPLGYVVVPVAALLLVFLLIVLPILGLTLVVGLVDAVRVLIAPGRSGRERVYTAASNLAIAGGAGALLFTLIDLLTSLSYGSSFHGRGAGIAALILTVLVGLGVVKVAGASWAFLVIARSAAACAVLVVIGVVLRRLSRPESRTESPLDA